MTGRENMSPMRPYWSPYLAGVALGLTLLATYLLMGFGLGASGAFAQVAARLEGAVAPGRSEEHTSELQSRLHLVCRLLLEKKKKKITTEQKPHRETNVTAHSQRTQSAMDVN